MPDDTQRVSSAEADVAKKRRWIGNGTATFIISVLVVLVFAGYIAGVTFFPIMPTLGKEQEGAIIGVLIANFSTVVGYYVGSSLGSANKSIELAGKK